MEGSPAETGDAAPRDHGLSNRPLDAAGITVLYLWAVRGQELLQVEVEIGKP